MFEFGNYCFEFGCRHRFRTHHHPHELPVRSVDKVTSNRWDLKLESKIENVDGGKSIALMLDDRDRRPFLANSIVSS